MEINWDILNKTATIITIVGIPSVLILYFTLWDKLKNLLIFKRNKYISKRLYGKITFDYSNNNGLYKIGKDKQEFDLYFSKSSRDNIILLNDPINIKGIAIAKDIYDISKIKDASIYDMSSRARRPNVNGIAILKNIYGNFCALKILNIKDDTRGDNNDEITFEYVINSDGFSDFRK